MKELNTLLGELGISKVKLAKYLGGLPRQWPWAEFPAADDGR